MYKDDLDSTDLANVNEIKTGTLYLPKMLSACMKNLIYQFPLLLFPSHFTDLINCPDSNC